MRNKAFVIFPGSGNKIVEERNIHLVRNQWQQ